MKFLIMADTVPTSTTEALFVNGDAKALYGDIAELAKGYDRVILNLECALTDSTGAIKKFGPNLKATPAAVNGLKALGVTDVALSNNHVFDFGIKGLRDTMATLEEAELPYMGVGENDTESRKPYIVEAEGKKIGFINVCEHEYTYALPNRLGANPFDPFLTMPDIRALKAECDYVIVIYHGGKEHCRYPSPRLYNLSHEMVLCGADLVIAQHSHCIGCYESFEGGHILYGQGNFNFVYPEYIDKSTGWFTGLLTEVEIGDKLDVKFYPLVATDTGCDLAKGAEADEIMTAFEERNASLLDGTWRQGWHDFCFSPEIKKNYETRTDRPFDDEYSRQNFAHYLDCEAHTDVWRELYPTWNMTNEL